jgi:DNA-binding GntR family transcriptional regulator
MTLSTPLDLQTLSDQAFEKIVAAIMAGDLAPGSRISEVELARTLGISRGPLREAIQRLEGRKLVKRTPRLGAHVAAPAASDIIDIFRVREALEGMACRLVAETASEEEVAELYRVLDIHHSSEELQHGKAYYQKAGELDFHYLIARRSRNSKLMELLCEDLYFQLRLFRYQSSWVPGRAQRAFDEHTAIVDAIAAHDADKAESLMRQHIAAARRNFEQEAGAAA